jgi:hypothetical protein
MAELKTQPTRRSVTAFLAAIPDDRMRRDSRTLLTILRRITKASPRMWGASIVGLGDYHFKYASGREGDWFLIGFSPRKHDLTLYLMDGLDRHGPLLAKLGRHKTGKGCLYLRTLEDIDLPTLERLLRDSVKNLKGSHRQG